MQIQRKPPRSSIHVPSFWQGFDSHSFIFISHRRPLNPGLQSHLYEPAVLTQIPSCSHGEPTIIPWPLNCYSDWIYDTIQSFLSCSILYYRVCTKCGEKMYENN